MAARVASGKHAFDLVCAEFGTRHRLAAPRHPQTNGMVERFNRRISDIVAQTRLSSASQLETTLTFYPKTCNHSIPQRALKHQTPIESIKAWREKKPVLFVKNVYESPGLERFLKRLIMGMTRKVFLIVDGHPMHKAKLVQKFVQENSDAIELFFLPPYAPELNPDELAWAHIKTRVTKATVQTRQDLKASVERAMHRLQKLPAIGAGFFGMPTCAYAKA